MKERLYPILSRLATGILLCLPITLLNAPSVYGQMANIKNDVFWNTADGKPIYSQGGGIFRFKNPGTGKLTYYWYGVHYEEADKYRRDPSVTEKGATFHAVTCYTSDDLVHWSFRGDVLTEEEVNRTRRTWVGRLGVAYIKELNQYALFVQHGSQVLITVSKSPAGPFKWYRQINMKPLIGTTNTGDQTVFTDEDTGKSYLIYSYGRGRNKIYVSEIGVKDGEIGLLDCTEVYRGLGREGNCLFKYKGKYYMCASNLYGWDGSDAYYLVADNILGPYKPLNDMKVMRGVTEDYAHVSQTGFFVTVRGTKEETVIFCGDRWADFAGNGLGYNQWCPLSFDKDGPYFNSLSSWNLNAQTGEWTVGKDNNYVKNGSFEADRKRIPSPVKPVQEHLLGWTSQVIKGNTIAVGEASSPILNHFNDEVDRKAVIGEKSLNISDSVAFIRKVYQKISSSPKVRLPDGYYRLSAKMKNSRGFKKLEMYATSGGKRFVFQVNEPNDKWTDIRVDSIFIKNGKVEIGFYADGNPDARCLGDDVSLIKQ